MLVNRFVKFHENGKRRYFRPKDNENNRVDEMADALQLMAMLGAYQSKEANSSTTFTSPSLIGNLIDLQKIKLDRHTRNRNDADIIYQSAKQAIESFKSEISSAIEEASTALESLTETSFNSEYTKFKTEYKESFKGQIKISNDLLLQGIDPTIYFSIKKHMLLAQVFIRLMDENKNVNLSSTKKSFSELKKNQELFQAFELGYFIALEPILVIGALNAIKWGDKGFIADYRDLVEKFSRIIARKYPSLYLQISGLGKKIFDSAEFEKYLNSLESNRNS
ncbi:MAG: hypothetical protein KGH77_04395 [Candidatus Micrarchaeota archaeon]|nr:hypothetical protein [Candidatus Micrarchaeota archaeon]MDE1864634.1 hypothetical protein [Candidatus Micrarchaeota archaeon]